MLEVLGTLWTWAWGSDAPFLKVYVAMRSSYFTGFLTTGSLFVAATNWILSTLKAQVYDSEAYKARFKELKEAGRVQGDILDPMKRLGIAMFATMTLCFATSIAQITLGLIERNLTAIICLMLPIITMGVSLFMLFQLWQNMRFWLGHDPGSPRGNRGSRKPLARRGNSPVIRQ